MAATREARKREMIANLDNDVYIKALVDEAYATIFTGSTTNTVAQKKVKRVFEAEGCHIGASAKHDTWEDKNGSFESVEAFLSSDNSSHVSESTSDGSGHRHDKWQYGCQ